MLLRRASLFLSRRQSLQQTQQEYCCRKYSAMIKASHRNFQILVSSETVNPILITEKLNCQQNALVSSSLKVASLCDFSLSKSPRMEANKIFFRKGENFENLKQWQKGIKVKGERNLQYGALGPTETTFSHLDNVFLSIPVRSFQSGRCSYGPVAASASTEQNEKDLKPKEYSEIPGPKPWPIVGNMIQMVMRKDFDIHHAEKLWANLFAEYGPILKMKFPGLPAMVASSNPDDLETFLKSTMDNPIRVGFQSLKRVRDQAPGNYFNKKTGLLPENGEEWWRLRSRVQAPLLRPRNVAMYLPKVDKATVTFMDRIDLLQEEHGRVPDNFLEDLYKWALECVGLVALDKELGCLEPDLPADSVPMQLIKHINDMFAALNETEMGMHTWKLYRSPAYVRLETAHAAFTDVAIKSIQEAEESLKATIAQKNPNRTLTVMETFLNTEGLSKSDVTTMILDMLFAGVDTTSHTVAFTLYLLAKNPECQSKLQDEIDRVMGDATAITPEHITEMIYMNYVLRESLRLFPLVIGNARLLTEDAVISGYKVPAGNMVMGFNMLICREEKHFKMANKFIPERWSRDRPFGPIHPFAAVPFSHGKRMCIGKRIAEQEIYTFLIRAMQKYRVTFESPLEMKVKTQLVLKPDIPLAFKFHPRNK